MTNIDINKLLSNILDQSNKAIDELIVLRDSAVGENKFKYRYVTRKLEVIVGACHRALDVNNNSVKHQLYQIEKE